MEGEETLQAGEILEVDSAIWELEEQIESCNRDLECVGAER
jgi:hypothetical protein